MPSRNVSNTKNNGIEQLLSLIGNKMVYILLKSKLSSSRIVNLFKFLVLLSLLCILFFSLNYTVQKMKFPINGTNLTIGSQFMSRHDWLINEQHTDIRSVYYRHATAARNTSYPLISGDTYRAFADFVFDETRQDNLESVMYGDSVFVKTDMFDHFFREAYQSIKNPFVLITHNSDFSAPRKYKTKLEEEKIIAWYASNPDIRDHPKLIPIPIGLANTRWPGGDLTKLMYAFRNHRKLWTDRTTLLYVNFSPGTNPGQRQRALSQAATVKNTEIIRKSIPFKTYLKNVGNAKFVLSPPGNGLDCHRTWEALLLGAVPIVLSSGLNPLFEGIPAVIVDNWASVTEEFLLSHNFSSFDHLTPVVLYARYWRDLIVKHRGKS